MSDIAVEFRIKNARLKRAILEKGWSSYSHFARANFISYPALIALLGMKKAACNQTGWRPVCVEIATALHCEAEDLWPQEMARAALRANNGEFAITLEEAAALTPARVNREALSRLLKGLEPREMRALTALARGETLDEAGKGTGFDGRDISRERVRQVAAKAMRRLALRAQTRDIEFTDIVETV